MRLALTPALFICYLLVAVLFVAGCTGKDAVYRVTSVETDINLSKQSGNLSAPGPTLQDEVSNPSDTPVLGMPGPGLPTPPAAPGAGNSSGGGTTSPGESHPGCGKLEKEDVDECEQEVGEHSDHIRMVHAGETLTLSGHEPIAIKITGHMPKVVLKISGDEGETLPGLCIFEMGDQPELELEIGVELKSFHYFGRGNHSKAVVDVDPLGSLLKFFSVDLRGNQASFLVKGPGKHICPSTRLTGNNPSLTCDPN